MASYLNDEPGTNAWSAWFASLCLVVMAVLLFLSNGSSFMARPLTDPTTLDIPLGIVMLLSFFIIGRWFYVAAKINHLRGLEGLRFSPGWAVGWYFIPVANLIMPYLSLRETHKASSNKEEWQQVRTSWVLPLWWGTFLLSGALYNIDYFFGNPSLQWLSHLDTAFLADMVLFFNALLLRGIIDTIDDHQREYYDNQ